MEGGAEADFQHEVHTDATPQIPQTGTHYKKGRKYFINSRLVVALDRAKLSDGDALHVLTAAAKLLGHEVQELVISRSSIRRQRKANRA